MADGIRKQLSDAASVVTLPAALTRNAARAAEAIIDIRDRMASLVDLPTPIQGITERAAGLRSRLRGDPGAGEAG